MMALSRRAVVVLRLRRRAELIYLSSYCSYQCKSPFDASLLIGLVREKFGHNTDEFDDSATRVAALQKCWAYMRLQPDALCRRNQSKREPRTCRKCRLSHRPRNKLWPSRALSSIQRQQKNQVRLNTGNSYNSNLGDPLRLRAGLFIRADGPKCGGWAIRLMKRCEEL
jgi:hypothetical protein